MNHHLVTPDSAMPQPSRRMGGWQLSPVHPQPCIKNDNREGKRLRSRYQECVQAQRVSSHSTQTPRFGLCHTTPLPNQVSRPKHAAAPQKRERPFSPSPAWKRMRTHDSPSDHRRDLRRRVHFLEESRHSMPARAKHERLKKAKSKEVRQPVFENHGRNRRDEGRASLVKIRILAEDSGPSTSASHPRETHRCSKCRRLGHYGKKMPCTGGPSTSSH
jgi:hypothetical protein